MSQFCEQVHRLFNDQKEYRYPFDVSEIPANGIYVIFEIGECSHDQKRIVRIGSHIGEGRLSDRLNEHFGNENKDRSIFRKNIGRALLNAEGDHFLRQWNLDLTYRKIRDAHSQLIDKAKQSAVEKAVSKHLHDRMSFAVVEVPDHHRRLDWEVLLIGTVAQCPACRPSKDWLGNQSPKSKIRVSGLWQEKHIGSEQMSEDEFAQFQGFF